MPETTVRLSNRRPVRIESDDWPLVASSTVEDDEEVTTLYVRRHEDGRGLIYYEFTNTDGEDQGRAGGKLVEGVEDDDVLAGRIERIVDEVGLDDRLVNEVLSKLSPEDLT